MDPLIEFWKNFKKEEPEYSFEDSYADYSHFFILKVKKNNKFYIVKGGNSLQEKVWLEKEALSRLENVEDIPRIEGYKTVKNYRWLIKDYVEGITLSKIRKLKNEKEMEQELKAKIHEIYDHDVCQLDIRNTNVIITPDFRPRLFDFDYVIMKEQTILGKSDELLLEEDLKRITEIFKAYDVYDSAQHF